MNANLKVGTEVVHVEKFREHTFRKYGRVVEIGTGKNDGRVRVLWSYKEGTNGYYRTDGKRTWMRADRVMVVPVDIL